MDLLILPMISVTLFFYLIHSCHSHALTTITTDQSALLAFKSRLFITPSHPLSLNWSHSTPVCTWIGVTCNSRHHRVASLTLYAMNLTGTLSPDIGNLTFLVALNLSRNNFYGTLPCELARLRRLQLIDLMFNNFTGDIPSGFFPELRFLSLRNNSFTNFLPNSISNLSKLEAMDVSYNSLTGRIPEGIGKLYNMVALLLQFNRLDGPIPKAIYNMSNLKMLALTGNSLTGNLPGDICGGLPSLNKLSLSLNELDGEIPSNISRCQKLTVLALSYNRLSGTIPRGIGELTNLEELYLGINLLTGEIPGELGNLQNLKLLGISNNFLVGGIPSSIFSIPFLGSLDLSRNSLIGPLPPDICSNSSRVRGIKVHGHCPPLEVLEITENNITGVIPKSLGNLTMLQVFQIGINNLTGRIPEELANLPNLMRLDIAYNSLMGTIPVGFFNMSTLKVLSIARNQLSGILPSDIWSGLPNLEELYFSENSFHGKILPSISNSSNLRLVELSENEFTGQIPDSLGDLMFLQNLLISGNNFVTASTELSFITSLTNCRFLKIIDLSNNPFNARLPISVGNLSSKFKTFVGVNSGLHGSIPYEFGNIQSLLLLRLAKNRLTGSIPKSLGNLQNLQGLVIPLNNLSGPIPDELCRVQSLSKLELSENQITGPIPECLGKINALRTINIGNNRLNSSIPQSIWQIKDLLEVNLSSNFLSGSLSPDMGKLKVAGLLDLSWNQFTGIIPNSIGEMKSLVNLSLAHNGFEGSIPESVGKLGNLEQLDLSHNKLSGSIPKSLEGLQYLTYLNLSYNHLSGEIPSGGPFKNFDGKIFMSNKGLCGNPRYGVPTCSLHGSNTREKILKVVYALLGVVGLVLILTLACISIRCWKKEALVSNDDLTLGITPLRASYHDLVNATEGFSESHLLGTGGYSLVYKGSLRNGEVVAIKVFNLQVQGGFKSFDTECEVLRNLRHRNLCKVLGSSSNESFKALILEYMPNGNLDKWIHSDGYFLNFVERINIMVDVACALEYLHHGYSTPIIHCDVKSNNVLLDEDMVAHLSDFGIAKLLGEEESVVITNTFATFGYIAPEYGSQGLVSTKCDVYSFGILVMEVFTKMKPSSEAFSEGLNLISWVSQSLYVSTVQIVDPELLEPEEEHFNEKIECFRSVMELALNCSTMNPSERICMKDVVVVLKKIKAKLLSFEPRSRNSR